MVVSTKKIIQYGPATGESLVYDAEFTLEGSKLVLDIEAAPDSDYLVEHLHYPQNPRPTIYNEGVITPDKETWSDSPTNDPTRAENTRYSYGRGPNPTTPGSYGNLDKHSGLVISQRLFGISCEYTEVDFLSSGSNLVYDTPFSESCDLVITPLAATSADVTLSQYPFVLEATPVPFSYKNPVTTNISLRISNYTSILDPNTVTCYVNGEERSEVTATLFYSGLGGLDLLWTNPSSFGYGEQVDVEWRVDDTEDPANTIIVSYFFFTVFDTIGPRLVSTLPTDNSIGNAINSCISISVIDYETGLNLNTIELYINNIFIPRASLTETVNSDSSVTLSYCPTENFLYNDLIAVSLYLEDTEGNQLFHVFNFSTERSAAPKAVSAIPLSGSVDIPIDSDVEVNLVGTGNSVKEQSVVFSIDGEQGDNPRLDPIIYREDD
jgi:hypothetical protein